MISILDLLCLSISLSLLPLYKKDKDGVSHGVRLSFINGLWSGVSGWWIVRHIMAVLQTHESFFSAVMSCLSSRRMNMCNKESGTAHPNIFAVGIISGRVAWPFICRLFLAKLALWIHAINFGTDIHIPTSVQNKNSIKIFIIWSNFCMYFYLLTWLMWEC